MKKPKMNMEEKLTFNKIEILIMIVLVALIVISAILVVSVTTRKKNIANFKTDASYIVSAAKNTYSNFDISGKTANIVTGSDGTTKGMCITIKGLIANGFLTSDYEDYDGYIVIEESQTHQFNYSVWLTNQKYVINGYDSSKIQDLDIKNGIEKYNDDEFTSKVRTSFAGTTSNKGGTGTDENNLLRYEAACVTEKVE